MEACISRGGDQAVGTRKQQQQRSMAAILPHQRIHRPRLLVVVVAGPLLPSHIHLKAEGGTGRRRDSLSQVNTLRGGAPTYSDASKKEALLMSSASLQNGTEAEMSRRAVRRGQDQMNTSWASFHRDLLMEPMGHVRRVERRHGRAGTMPQSQGTSPCARGPHIVEGPGADEHGPV